MNYTLYSKKPETKIKPAEYEPVKKIDGQAPAQTDAEMTKIVKVANCEKLNLRAGVSTDSKIICVLNKGTELLVVHEEDEWAYVKVMEAGGFTSFDGFVMRKYTE